MGKTPQPLSIVCVGIWGPEFESLEAQGHEVTDLTKEVDWDGTAEHLLKADLIVGPNCWRFLPHLTRYLPLALKEARAAARKRKPKK